jgi:hypothetical protein
LISERGKKARDGRNSGAGFRPNFQTKRDWRERIELNWAIVFGGLEGAAKGIDWKQCRSTLFLLLLAYYKETATSETVTVSTS